MEAFVYWLKIFRSWLQIPHRNGKVIAQCQMSKLRTSAEFANVMCEDKSCMLKVIASTVVYGNE